MMSQRTEPRNKADGACADGTAAVTMRRGGGCVCIIGGPQVQNPQGHEHEYFNGSSQGQLWLPEPKHLLTGGADY